MKQSIANFLEFRGKNLIFLAKNGVYYIAIKPICEVLEVDYIRQFKNMKDDPILRPALSKQTMQVPGDQTRALVCLPEHLIYGWIFSIKSQSVELLEYKKDCYEILFKHFHGAITNRLDLLRNKARVISERKKAESELTTNELFLKVEMLKQEESKITRALTKNDKDIFNEQLKLFN